MRTGVDYTVGVLRLDLKDYCQLHPRDKVAKSLAEASNLSFAKAFYTLACLRVVDGDFSNPEYLSRKQIRAIVVRKA